MERERQLYEWVAHHELCGKRAAFWGLAPPLRVHVIAVLWYYGRSDDVRFLLERDKPLRYPWPVYIIRTREVARLSDLRMFCANCASGLDSVRYCVNNALWPALDDEKRARAGDVKKALLGAVARLPCPRDCCAIIYSFLHNSCWAAAQARFFGAILDALK